MGPRLREEGPWPRPSQAGPSVPCPQHSRPKPETRICKSRPYQAEQAEDKARQDTGGDNVSPEMTDRKIKTQRNKEPLHINSPKKERKTSGGCEHGMERTNINSHQSHTSRATSRATRESAMKTGRQISAR